MIEEFKQYTLEELRKMKSKTDIEKFNETTEKQIKEQIISDPDLPNLTEEEMKEFDFPKVQDKNNEK
jgi:hypothetical protein